jgi:uncharacterized protein (TIGR03435 family)
MIGLRSEENGMRTRCKNAVTRGFAIAGLMALQTIAFAQAGMTFEVSLAPPSPVPVSLGRNYAAATVSRSPQRIAFQRALIGDIVAFAYELPLDRVERRPQWMYDDRYNVAVATEAPASLPEQKLMLQKLLDQRFGLLVHRISYPSPVYFLVAGPKVHLTPAQEPGEVDVPEFRLESGTSLGGRYVPSHASMSDLAARLYSQMQLPVLDKTGITGFFDIEITAPPGRPSAESMIRAVQNSLGLDLQLQHGTAESLIIDHAEQPN